MARVSQLKSALCVDKMRLNKINFTLTFLSFSYRDALTTYRAPSSSKSQLSSIHDNDINLIEVTSFINLIEITSFINQENTAVDDQLSSIYDNNIHFIEVTSFINFIDATSFINQKNIVDKSKYVINNDEDINKSINVVTDVQMHFKDAALRQTLKKTKLAEKLCQKIRERKYKATLILTPAQKLSVWKKKRKNFFSSLTLRQFYSSANKSTFINKIFILNIFIIDLFKYLIKFSNASSVISIVILSFYATWSRRFMFWDNELISVKAIVTRNRIFRVR